MARKKLTLSSAWPSCSLVYWKVRDAKGVTVDPKELARWLDIGEYCASCDKLDKG